jgi:carbonic anhydrase
MRNRHSCLHGARTSSRRTFIKIATLAGGALLLVPAFVRRAAAGETDILLLSCMDYRLMDDVARYMEGRGLREKYDHVVLAGAAIGVLNEKYPEWGKTFWDHVQVASDLHNIKKVIVLDHRDCGAYKVFLGADHAKTRESETEAHTKQLRKLRETIKAKHPKLEVELLLMALDGKVETVS